MDGWKDHADAIQRRTLKPTTMEKSHCEIARLCFKVSHRRDDSNLIILKVMQLESMLTDLKPVIHDETRVLRLLNGIGHEEVIGTVCSKEDAIKNTCGLLEWKALAA